MWRRRSSTVQYLIEKGAKGQGKEPFTYMILTDVVIDLIFKDSNNNLNNENDEIYEMMDINRSFIRKLFKYQQQSPESMFRWNWKTI